MMEQLSLVVILCKFTKKHFPHLSFYIVKLFRYFLWIFFLPISPDWGTPFKSTQPEPSSILNPALHRICQRSFFREICERYILFLSLLGFVFLYCYPSDGPCLLYHFLRTFTKDRLFFSQFRTLTEFKPAIIK